MKNLVLVVAFGALVALVMLGSVFGVDVSPQGILEFLANTVETIANFFAKLLEGLMP